MEVKGTLLLHWVKAIRANRDKDWSDSLTAEDWELIDGRILPSNWYPFEQWVRIGSALFKVAGNRDLNLTRVFGLDWMKNFLEVYKNILVDGDPAASITKFGQLRIHSTRIFIHFLKSSTKAISLLSSRSPFPTTRESTANPRVLRTRWQGPWPNWFFTPVARISKSTSMRWMTVTNFTSSGHECTQENLIRLSRMSGLLLKQPSVISLICFTHSGHAFF